MLRPTLVMSAFSHWSGERTSESELWDLASSCVPCQPQGPAKRQKLPVPVATTDFAQRNRRKWRKRLQVRDCSDRSLTRNGARQVDGYRPSMRLQRKHRHCSCQNEHQRTIPIANLADLCKIGPRKIQSKGCPYRRDRANPITAPAFMPIIAMVPQNQPSCHPLSVLITLDGIGRRISVANNPRPKER